MQLFSVNILIAAKLRYIQAPDGCLVATPSAAYTNTVWQAALAGPEVGKEIINMVSESPNTLLRYVVKAEMRDRAEWEKNFGMPASRANGYTPSHLTYGSASGIQREIRVAAMATTGAIAMSSAISTSIDQAMPANPLRVLTGDYGCEYGFVNWGLEEEIRGSRGGKNIHEWVPIVRKDLAQEICNKLETDLHSTGGATAIDGLGMWRATTGTKWNSADLGTATYLKAQSGTCTVAEFTKAKLRNFIRQCTRGAIPTTTNYQSGRKPNVGLVTSDLLDLIKGWLDDREVHYNQVDKDLDFVKLGTPNDYAVFDGVTFIVDNYLDSQVSTNFGLMYLLNADDIELITHQDYGWSAIDPWTPSGDTPPEFKKIELPSYLYKQVMKAIVLVNMFYKRPRHLGYFTIT